MKITCETCRQPQYVPITKEQYYGYKTSGKYVQNYFPDLTDDQREMLISGTCNPCWDEMFPMEDE